MIRRVVLALAAAALVAAGCGDDDSAQDAKTSEEAAMKKDDEAAMKKDDDAMAARYGARVKVVSSEFGRVIADRRGEAVYLFDKEKGSTSRCYGECAVAWPPLVTEGKPRAGGGADESLLGTTKRRDGKTQVTYNGHPLYYFKGDEPGTILCHNVDEFGGLWLVVDPSGEAVG
jgi:predicted lipoprotein with Yx(FWY)xxD motif